MIRITLLVTAILLFAVSALAQPLDEITLSGTVNSHFGPDTTLLDDAWVRISLLDSGRVDSVQTNEAGFWSWNMPTAIDDEHGSLLPTDLSLPPNYPNPFSGTTKIPFFNNAQQPVKLSVYNILGQKVVDLVDEDLRPGFYELHWAGTNEFGLPVSSGIYFASLQAPSRVKTRKIVLLDPGSGTSTGGLRFSTSGFSGSHSTMQTAGRTKGSNLDDYSLQLEVVHDGFEPWTSGSFDLPDQSDSTFTTYLHRLNEPPAVTAIWITSVDSTGIESLIGHVIGQDPDNDEVAWIYDWQVAGIWLGINDTILHDSLFVPHDTVRFLAQPSDPELTGEEVVTDPFVVRPEVAYLSGTVRGYFGEDTSAVNLAGVEIHDVATDIRDTVYTDDNGDWSWTGESVTLAARRNTPYTPRHRSSLDELSYLLTFFHERYALVQTDPFSIIDGQDSVFATYLHRLNEPPAVTAIWITSVDSTGIESLIGHVIGQDPDNDEVAWIYDWQVAGIWLGINDTILHDSLFVPHDTVRFLAQPSDPELTGEEVVTDPFVVRPEVAYLSGTVRGYFGEDTSAVNLAGVEIHDVATDIRDTVYTDDNGDWSLDGESVTLAARRNTPYTPRHRSSLDELSYLLTFFHERYALVQTDPFSIIDGQDSVFATYLHRLNEPPAVTAIWITSVDSTGIESLIGHVIGQDPDNDEVAWIYDWQVAGIWLGINDTILHDSLFVPHDTVRFLAQPSDPELTGEEVVTDPFVVRPEVAYLSGTVRGYFGEDTSAVNLAGVEIHDVATDIRDTVYTDDNGDWSWTGESVTLAARRNTPYTPRHRSSLDELSYLLTFFHERYALVQTDPFSIIDGQDSVFATYLHRLNEPPAVTAIWITSVDSTGIESLIGHVIGQDPDNDEVAWIYDWQVAGIWLGINDTILHDSLFVPGDSTRFWAQPADAEALGVGTDTVPFIIKQSVHNDSGSVGSDGGHVQIADTTSPIGGSFVDIPLGALDSTITVTITHVQDVPQTLSDSNVVIVDFQPSGIEFSIPVRIGIPFPEGYAYDGTDTLIVGFINDIEGVVQEIPVDSIDAVNRIAIAYVSHFSQFLVTDRWVDFSWELLNYSNHFAAQVSIVTPFNQIPPNLLYLAMTGITNCREIINTYPTLIGSSFRIKLRRVDFLWHTTVATRTFTYRVSDENADGYIVELKRDDGTVVYQTSRMDFQNVLSWYSGAPFYAVFDEETPDPQKDYYLEVDWNADQHTPPPPWTITMKYDFETFPLHRIRWASVPLVSDDQNQNSIRDAYEGPENTPPNSPSSPVPVDGATGQSVNVDLSWIGSDPDGDPLTYDVYFGMSSNPPLVNSGQSSANYNLGTLYSSQHYYWKIVAHDDHGHSTPGSVWSFLTAASGNAAPNPPSTPSPSNGATSQSVNVDLSWTCTDPNSDPLTYDIYFGTSSNPPLVNSGQSGTTYDPGTLSNSQLYYWKIVARDNHSNSTPGSVWSFTTGTGGGNADPNPPSNPSPSNGATNQSVNVDLSWTCSDPDSDPLLYDLYWGTSSNPPLVNSGQSATSYNLATLSNSQTYYWKIVAHDDHGHSTAGSVWSFTTGAGGTFEGMVLVTAGEFTMGRSGVATPEHQVYLDAYYIDVYEVTNAQYKEFCDSFTPHRTYPPDPGFSSMPNYFESATYANFPVVNVTWQDAVDYATLADKRLPTEAEWERAAKGNLGNLSWPWGDTWEAARANIYNNPADSFAYTSPVGNYPSGISPAGCYDMAGNVWEWCHDWYAAYTAGYQTNPQGLQPAPIVLNGVVDGATIILQHGVPIATQLMKRNARISVVSVVPELSRLVLVPLVFGTWF